VKGDEDAVTQGAEPESDLGEHPGTESLAHEGRAEAERATERARDQRGDRAPESGGPAQGPPAVVEQLIARRQQATATTARTHDREYRIVRSSDGHALRYERVVAKVKGKAARKAAKRARRAGVLRMKVNHVDIVEQEHQKQPPTSGNLQSVFAFQERVLARLAREFPTERWGYLKKGGENTIQFNGETVKVGRVCDPTTQLYKIVTDVPTTNGPVWNDDGILTVDFPGSDPSLWFMPFTGGVVEPPAPPLPPMPDIQAQLDRIEQQCTGTRAALANLAANTADQVVHLESLIKQLSDQIAHLGGGGVPPAELSTILSALSQVLAGVRAKRTTHTPYLGQGSIDPL
jgi:hypothetical protein